MHESTMEVKSSSTKQGDVESKVGNGWPQGWRSVLKQGREQGEVFRLSGIRSCNAISFGAGADILVEDIQIYHYERPVSLGCCRNYIYRDWRGMPFSRSTIAPIQSLMQSRLCRSWTLSSVSTIMWLVNDFCFPFCSETPQFAWLSLVWRLTQVRNLCWQFYWLLHTWLDNDKAFRSAHDRLVWLLGVEIDMPNTDLCSQAEFRA